MTKIQHLPETQIKESLDAFLMRLERIKADPFIHAKGVVLASDFIKSLEPYREEQLFSLLVKEHPEEAERLRRARVVFSDIPYYPVEMVKIVIEGVEPEELTKALMGYDAAFVDSFLELLPKKRAWMIQNDLYHRSDDPPHSQCAECRRKIVSKLESEFEKNRLNLTEYWKQLDHENGTTPSPISSSDGWMIEAPSKAS
jgi:flagellar motor switch protein FliG